VAALCLLAALVIMPGAAAQTVQPPPLRIIVPLPAGATSDILARVLADALKADFARPVIVDNRPGASGRIAVDALRSAAADGSTVMLAPIAVAVVVPLTLKDVHYDPARDLVPVALLDTFDYALAVAADHPARDLAQFVARARANPDRATFGTPGVGSVPQFIGAQLAQASGVSLLHVPYRGAAGVASDVMGGQVSVAISAVADFAPLHRAGRMRILATSGAHRSPLVPEVPTFREQGFPMLELTGWHGVFAPAKTPSAIVESLSAAFVAALGAPATRERINALGLESAASSSDAFASRIAADTERWRRLVKASGFVAE
jgi:tripartite-type tricarboxylate transporter receptor subunit TctC